jgi:hypothetical protein
MGGRKQKLREPKSGIYVIGEGDIFVICVFDLDVSMHNESERKKLELLKNKYQKNKNLLFCNSLPSIEYWFLLHYENTNRHFNNFKAVETALKKHISNYEKTAQFLEKEKWVNDLCSENKLNEAVEHAKRFKLKHGSYTNVNEAIDILTEELRKMQKGEY